MGANAMNLVLQEDTDTETVMDMSVTVTTEKTLEVRSAQIRQC